MGHTWENLSHFKNVSHLKIWVTLRKTGHIWKNGSHLGECVKLGLMGHTWKNGSHLEK